MWKTSFHPRILALHCLALFFRSFFALLARDARCYCQRLPFKILCEASFSPPLKRKILFLPNHIEFFICSFALRCVLSLWPVCFKLRQTNCHRRFAVFLDLNAHCQAFFDFTRFFFLSLRSKPCRTVEQEINGFASLHQLYHPYGGLFRVFRAVQHRSGGVLFRLWEKSPSS